MKFIEQTVYLLSFILLSCSFANAQTGPLNLEDGVAPHKGVDAVYAQFSKAYATLDVELVTNLYTENAAYLAPGSNIQNGRAEIKTGFKSFFDWVKKNGQTMTISFHIFQRRIDKKIGYDVGIYTIRQYKDGEEVSIGQGKFVVVAVKDKDREWRFQVDGYSDLKPEKKEA